MHSVLHSAFLNAVLTVKSAEGRLADSLLSLKYSFHLINMYPLKFEKILSLFTKLLKVTEK